MDAVLLGMIKNIKGVPVGGGDYSLLGSDSAGNPTWVTNASTFVPVTMLNYNLGLSNRRKTALSLFDASVFVPPNIVLTIYPTMLQWQTLLANGSITLSTSDCGVPLCGDIFAGYGEYFEIFLGTDSADVGGRLKCVAKGVTADVYEYHFIGDLYIIGYSALGVQDGIYPISLHAKGNNNFMTLTASFS